MSDVNGAAPAASEPSPAPAAPPAPAAEKAYPASPREAVDSAFAQLELDEPAQPPRPVQSTTKPVEKAEAKPKPAPAKIEAKATTQVEKPKVAEPAKPLAPRTPTGQFAPKEAREGEGEEAAAESLPAAAPKSAYAEPPKRFSEEARAAWAEAPEPVRAEIHRATRELEQGIQKYRGDAEAFSELKDFDNLAKQSGTTLKAAMQNYVGIEQKLRQDFIGGLDLLCRNRGITLRGLAERIMQQPPNESAARQDQIVAGLHQKIAQLEQQIGGVTKGIETEKSNAILTDVQSFSEQVGLDRFEELAPDITMFIQNGRARDLQHAYELADQINPGSSSPARPAPSPETPAAQTRKGTLAIHGAPSSGSDPATRKPPKNARAAVDDAFAALGLG